MAELFDYSDIVKKIENSGISSSPRNFATKELIGKTIILPSAITSVGRKNSNMRLAWLESMMIFGGIFDIDLIAKIAPNCRLDLYEKQSDYGPRIIDQLINVEELLLDDPQSRRAIVFFNDRSVESDDMTCVTSIQFLIRDEVLYSIVSQRSWDMIYGFTTDIVTLGFLHNVMAKCLGIEAGPITVNVGSLHYYLQTHSLGYEVRPLRLFTLTDSIFNTGIRKVSGFCYNAAYSFAEDPTNLPFSASFYVPDDNKVFNLY